MMNRIVLFSLLTIVFASCGSIEVTKRRHMPGYHVDLGKQKQKTTDTNLNDKAADAQRMEQVVPVSAHLSRLESDEMSPSYVVWTSTSEFVRPADSDGAMESSPVAESQESVLKQTEDMRSRRLRASVFPTQEEEKYGWSIISIIALGLGTIGFILMFLGLIWAIVQGPLWFLPAILGLMFGIGGLITGAIGLKQTKRGGRKGRGFALGGLISGVIALFISFIALLVGAVLALNV